MPLSFKFAIGATVLWGTCPPRAQVPWIVHQCNYWANATQVLIHYALVPRDHPQAPARWVTEDALVPWVEEV